MTVTMKEAIWIIAGIIAIMATGLFLVGAPISVILLIEVMFAMTVALFKKVPYADIQKAMLASISEILAPVFIMLLIGALVSSWIMGGTVPTLICIGLRILNETYFFLIAFLMCSITSMIIGTSFGTISTMGIAFMGISNAMGLPPVYTIAAIVSGAMLGDKTSPFSSTVVLAGQLAGATTGEVMKALAKTNGPAVAASIVIFAALGSRTSVGSGAAADDQVLLDALHAQFEIGFLAVLPPILLLALIILKVPIIPAFLIGIIIGTLESVFLQGMDLATVTEGLLSGHAFTENPRISELLSYGGINGMGSLIILLMFAAAFGGVIKQLGLIDCILEKVLQRAHSGGQVVIASVLVHLCCFVMTGNAFATNSVLAPAYRDVYDANGLKRGTIASVFIDAGAGLSPMIPWCATYAFVAATLGAEGIAHCLYCPIIWLPPLMYPMLHLFRK